jgi:hypothetical protein
MEREPLRDGACAATSWVHAFTLGYKHASAQALQAKFYANFRRLESIVPSCAIVIGQGGNNYRLIPTNKNFGY